MIVNPYIFLNPINDGLVAYWKANNTANDEQGAHNGTLQNGATYGTGHEGQAFSLDGVDDYISMSPILGSSVSAPTQPHSFCAWINPSNVTDSYNAIICNSGLDKGTMLLLNQNRIGFFSQGLTTVNSSNVTVSISTWTHVAVVYDGAGSVKFYKNGVYDVTRSTGIWTESGAIDSYIGTYAYGGFFNGLIDECRVYDRALSDSEVLAIYSL